MREIPLAVDALIVEDHELLAASVALALQAAGLVVERPGSTSPTTVLERCEVVRPRTVLLDLDLGDDVDGTALVAPLTALGARVVVVTGQRRPAALGACLEAGAWTVVAKQAPLEDLIEVVRATLDGTPVLSVARRQDLVAAAQRHRAETRSRLERFRRLTPREHDVLLGLVEGKSVDQIAAEAVVAVSTIRTHVKSLLLKLGVHSQLAAVALARHHGWHAAA